jgi:hypothetical protein
VNALVAGRELTGLAAFIKWLSLNHQSSIKYKIELNYKVHNIKSESKKFDEDVSSFISLLYSLLQFLFCWVYLVKSHRIFIRLVVTSLQDITKHFLYLDELVTISSHVFTLAFRI